MLDPTISQTHSRLSEAIVMAEPEDLPVLGQVHADLGLLADWAEADGKEETRARAREAADTVEKIIFREHPDAAGALAAIASFLNEVQRIIDTPNDLGTAQPPAGPTDAPIMPDAVPVVEESMQRAGEAYQLQADPGLLSDFIGEAREHLEHADNELLTLEATPTEAESLNAVFRAFHTIKGVAGFLDLVPVQQLAHETETLLDNARKGSLALTGSAMDVTFEANDLMKALIDSIAQAAGQGGSVPAAPQLPDLLAKIRHAGLATEASPPARTQPAKTEPEAANTDDDFFADDSTPATKVMPNLPAEATVEPNAQTPATRVAPVKPEQAENVSPAKQRFSGIVQETIKVDAHRLDSLVDTIGEMVIAEAMVRQSFAGSEAERMRVPQILGQLDKITRELQELAMSLRMVPVKSTFQRMARLARDTAKKLGKPITFVTSGDDTELDKTVVDVIGDPLVHMIRNAIDHGLEAKPADRVAASKLEQGRIELRARHQGGSIIIEISDDGRGLDRDVLLAKAKERGLIQDGHHMSDHEVYNLIFEAGFSTAKQVSDVSGRGVGLDVVKKNIQSLRGKVEITSQPGKGSTFSIRLPLTLAIIDGMVVRSGGQRYIIPTLSITRMIRHNEMDISTVLKRGEMLTIGEDLIPLFHLNHIFALGQGAQPEADSEIVVVEDEGRNYALVIDEILGQQQIVIKPLGQMFKQVAGVSGGAIMPDGRVGLILDITGLIAMTGQKTLRAAA